jgi:tetratricopeptide (TPR) repeat protein
VFDLGFVLLWHGDLDEATVVLRESLAEAERRGDVTVRSRALTYLMVAGRKRGDVEEVCHAVSPVIEAAREASLPEYEAMAIANRAWVAWRSGDKETATADAQAALQTWESLPARYPFDWMALWPLIAIAVGSQQIEQAADYARRLLAPPQQPLQQPARTLAEDAVHARDAGQLAQAEELLHRAVRAAGDLGYL